MRPLFLKVETRYKLAKNSIRLTALRWYLKINGIDSHRLAAIDSRACSVYCHKAVQRAMTAVPSESIRLSAARAQKGGQIAWVKGTQGELKGLHSHLSELVTHHMLFVLTQIFLANAGPVTIDVSTTPEGSECQILIQTRRFIPDLELGSRLGLHCTAGVNVFGGSSILIEINEASVRIMTSLVIVDRRIASKALPCLRADSLRRAE